MSDDFIENVQKKRHWLRILYMLVFFVALYVTGAVILVLVVAQALFTLVTGSDNINLRRLGNSLSIYVHEMLRFLTYNSEYRPFPFSSFPIAGNALPAPGDDHYGETVDGETETDPSDDDRPKF